jgi:dihydropyrimidinase
MYELVIKQGMIVTAVSTYRADIGIDGEKIVAIGKNLQGKRELDASGKLVIPGGVDVHVHLQMPIGQFTSTDDFLTGTRAAAHGGTTTVIDFVETQPNQTMVEAIAARRALADPKVVVDYGLHMTIAPSDIDKLDQAPAAYAAGCQSFKLYMAYGHCLNDGQLYQALQAIKAVNGMPVVHAENWEVICALVAENVANGRLSPHWHPRSRPELMEGEAANRIIRIAELVGSPIHIFHVSCQDVVAEIAAARARGASITGETCPQYLYLTQAVYDAAGEAGALPVCSPPLRPQAEQDYLWNALAANNLQIVSTDHCPFTQAEKATGLGNYSTIPGGVPSIEMRLSAIYQGVRNGRLSANQWVNLCCTAPAKRLNLHNKGEIAIGRDADIVIFDPEKEVVLSTDSLHESADWTPYEGMTMTGWAETTLCRGQILIENGEFVGGNGRFIN